MAKMQSIAKLHTHHIDIMIDETVATTGTAKIAGTETTNEEGVTTITAARTRSNLSQLDSRMTTGIMMIERKVTGKVVSKTIVGAHKVITTDEIGQSTDAMIEVKTSA